MPRTCKRRNHISPNARPTNSYGKLGASNKCTRALLVPDDEAFENWPYPFMQDMSKSIKHSPRSVWTCPTNDTDLDHMLATLIELLGCPNEGWAKNAYCGLLDLLEHGDEDKLTKAMKQGGIPAFRKLFANKPHYSATWDGFVAGLDIFERMLSCEADLRRICIDGLGIILRPIIQSYIAREQLSFGMSQQNLGNQIRCAHECRNRTRRGTARYDQQNKTANDVTIRKNFNGLTKHPFTPDLDTWLRRLETVVLLTSDPDSDDYAYMLSHITRWYPSYEGLKSNVRTGFVRRPVRRPETPPAEQKSNRKPIPVKRPKEPRTKPSITAVSEVDGDDWDTLDCDAQFCLSGPGEFHAGHYPMYGKLKRVTQTEPQDSSVTGRKDRFERERKQDQVPSDWYQQKAAKLVEQVFSKVNSAIISEQEKHQHCIDSDARSVHLVAVDIHLSVPEHAAIVKQNHSDLSEELASRHSEEPKTRSVDTYRKLSFPTNRSQDRALMEDAQSSHSVVANDMSEEVIEYSYQTSETIQGRQRKDTEDDMGTLSLIVNRSYNIDMQQSAEEPNEECGTPYAGPDSSLHEDADYQFTIVESSAAAALGKTDEENQQQKSVNKPEVSWKLYKKSRLSNESVSTDRKPNDSSLSLNDRRGPNSKFQLVNTKVESEHVLVDPTQTDQIIQPKSELLARTDPQSDDAIKTPIDHAQGLKPTVLHPQDALHVPPEAPNRLPDSQTLHPVEGALQHPQQYDDVKPAQVPENQSSESISFTFLAPLPAKTSPSVGRTDQHVVETSDVGHPPTGQVDQPDPSITSREDLQNVDMNGQASKSPDKSEQNASGCILENIKNQNHRAFVESLFEQHPSISKAILENILTTNQLEVKGNDQLGSRSDYLELPAFQFHIKKSDANAIGSSENPTNVETTSAGTSDRQDSDGPQFVRVYVHLKARASWRDSSDPCAVEKETHVETSPVARDDPISTPLNLAEDPAHNSEEDPPNEIEKDL